MTSTELDTRMDTLAEDAEYLQPRLFAIYGIYNHGEDELLGWGMEFDDGLGTLFYEPQTSSTWHSRSAKEVLASHQIIADARLRWLD